MFASSTHATVTIQGVVYKKRVILADVNIPYKFSVDHNCNNLFFCINADQFSEQSFHSVLLNLDTGSTTIVPGIRNGFASAVDQTTGIVYLGGSDGVFSYNYHTSDIDKPAVVSSIDIFDMFYKDALYFVDTGSQTLHISKYGTNKKVDALNHHLIHHFVIDRKNNVFFVNSGGLHFLKNGSRSVTLLDNHDLYYRGAAINSYGEPYFVGRNGIYSLSKETFQPQLIFSVENAYAVAFDKFDNIIYGDERTVNILYR